MHRDISRNNLVYREIDGKVCGVLHDFDLSVLPPKDPRSTSTSAPEPSQSLYYVLQYVVCQYHKGKKIDNPPFDAWGHLSMTALRTAKVNFLAFDALTVLPTSNFLSFRRLTLLHIFCVIPFLPVHRRLNPHPLTSHMDAFASLVSYFVAEPLEAETPDLPTIDEDKASGTSGGCTIA
ncbi:hypothetical protein C8J57DRAFT_1510714 [Mycena rebaudengoi]|nr:hypothetical protein C8J57DRAFT_1510714 [Mycena rebaudengoi]